MTKKNRQEFDILLILRGLLAILVVVWHFALYAGTAPALLSTPGRTAVWIFFGISGYVISYGFFSKRYGINATDLKAFYINRFLRIYPLFFLLSLAAFVTAYLLNGKVALQFSDIPSQLLMLQFDHTYVLNGVFWTLGIEVQYYLVAPLLAMFFLYPFKYPALWYTAIYCLLLLWMPFTYFFGGKQFDSRNLLYNLPHFFAGMAACKFFMFDKKNVQVNVWLVAALALLFLFLTNYFYRDLIRLYWTMGSVMIDAVIVLSVMLHSVLRNKTVHKENLFVRALTFLGVISYGIYAWHSYLKDYIPIPGNNAMIALAVTVFIAFLSYRFVEKPLLKLKRTRRKVDEAW
jgi:peptidoglycan/LPS O-acetylase OafA/YrhL